MISLKDLKNKIEEIEKQIEENGFSIEDINIHIDYTNSIDNIELDFICDEYYGIFVKLEIINEI